jgi:hypothetical protein
LARYWLDLFCGGASEDVLAMLRQIPGGAAGVRPLVEEAIRQVQVRGF